MKSLPQRNPRPERLKDGLVERHQGSRVSDAEPSADPMPIQAWRAWTDCGDGGQVHLILDRQAQQLWLLPSDESHIDPRSTG